MPSLGRLFLIPILLLVFAVRIAGWSFATNACAQPLTQAHTQTVETSHTSGVSVAADSSDLNVKITKRHRRPGQGLRKILMMIPTGVPVFAPETLSAHSDPPQERASVLKFDSSTRPPC
jgi:hypothetical protein